MNFDDLLALLKGTVIKVKIELEISLVTTPEASQPGQDLFTAKCEYCGWEKQYSSPLSASRAKSAHMAHCTAYADATDYIAAIQQSKSGT